MSKWTKWLLVTAFLTVPTVGLAVTKYRAQHKACPVSPGCPCAKAKL